MANSKKPWYAPRNPVLRSQLQHHGGAHKTQKPRKKMRSVDLLEDYEDWREELAFERSLKDRSDSSSVYLTLMV